VAKKLVLTIYATCLRARATVTLDGGNSMTTSVSFSIDVQSTSVRKDLYRA
jgi:hypothetical protein